MLKARVSARHRHENKVPEALVKFLKRQRPVWWAGGERRCQLRLAQYGTSTGTGTGTGHICNLLELCAVHHHRVDVVPL